MTEKKRGRISRIFAFIGKFVSSQWAQYNTTGQFLFALALIAIVIDAAIASQYGREMSILHAAGFAVVAIAFCVLPDISIKAWREGQKGAAAALAIACIPLGVVSYGSHIGYQAGIRLGDIQQTGFQHASLDGTQAVIDNSKATLKSYMEQKATLAAEREDVKAKSPWVTVTTAEALRAEVKVLDGRIADEIAGKRGRAKGCKTFCEKLQDEKRQVVEKIAAVERLDDVTKRIVELDASIEQTQRAIDEKTAALVGMGYRSSAVVNQNDVFTKAFNIVQASLGFAPADASVLKPTAVQREVTNTAITATGSLAFMLCGVTLLVGAGLNRLPGVGGGHDSNPVSEPDRQSHTETARAYPQPTDISFHRQSRPMDFGVSTATIGQLRRMAGQAA